MDSVLVACGSCMRYLEAPIQMAKDDGKTIILKHRAYPGMKQIKRVKDE